MTPDTESFGERLVERLYSLKRERNEKVTREEMIQVANACFNEEMAMRKKNKVAKQDNDAIFEAIIEACGLNRAEAMATAGARIGKAAADIRTATPNVTPQEIKRRASLYRSKHPTWPLTPTSLAGHWSEFAPRDADHIRMQLDPYVEPLNWRELARKTYPDADINWDEKQWPEISTSTRTDILKRNLCLPK